MKISRKIGDVRFDLFLNTDKVKRMLDKKTRRVLMGAGGTSRKIARNSMRKGNKKTKKSPPGEPPRWHAGHLKAKDKLLFFYDPKQQSVVIGSVPFKTQTVKAKGVNSTAALHEIGGNAVITYREIRSKRTGRILVPKERKRARYPTGDRARAFMRPTMPDALKRMKELLRTIPLKG